MFAFRQHGMNARDAWTLCVCVKLKSEGGNMWGEVLSVPVVTPGILPRVLVMKGSDQVRSLTMGSGFWLFVLRARMREFGRS